MRQRKMPERRAYCRSAPVLTLTLVLTARAQTRAEAKVPAGGPESII
jgi:hypothetical protein